MASCNTNSISITVLQYMYSEKTNIIMVRTSIFNFHFLACYKLDVYTVM